MNDEDLRRKVRDLAERIDDLEDERARLRRLPDAVATLQGSVKTLTELVNARFDRVDGEVERAAGIKTAITFAGVVIVPILVALIGAYFVVRAGGAAR